MNKILLKTIRAGTAVTLIVGSLYVQHVVRARQSADRQADLQFTGGVGSELAAYVKESDKPLLTLVR